ncbi:MAG: methyltransferase domain-containing protein, partial [Ignavibacteriaceae bacterium]|nr:methyltransferase domain-containing protein [Ignavibacteriaceae bacterium]
TVLELGAGNCSFAKHFSIYFPKLLVTDISQNMLLSNESGLFPRVCCNMTALPFKNKFDIIYSTFDSVNYLTSRKKLLDMFKQVSGLLTDKGVFTFDASLEKNSLLHAKEPERKGSYNGIKFKQKSEYDTVTKIHKNTFMIKLETGEIFSEMHKQKIFPFETYFELLEQAGLLVKHCYTAFTYKDGSGESERVQFITKRIRKNVDL